jgi:nitrate reductase gamma subunit
MDELFFFFILPMVAAAVVAVVEWRRYREGSEHGERIVGLEYRISSLETLASTYEPPDTSSLSDRIKDLEYAVNTLGVRTKALEDDE